MYYQVEQICLKQNRTDLARMLEKVSYISLNILNIYRLFYKLKDIFDV